MKVSIIVPIYNGYKHIDKCLNSLIHQDFSDYQIILVNDGSTDNTSQLCHEYESRYRNIVVVDQENKKDGGARNAGLRIAKGDYILFVDVDDYIEPNTLSITYQKAIKGNYDLVYFSNYEELENHQIINKIPFSEKTRIAIVCWNKLIKRSYIKNFCIENKFSNDLNFSMKLHKGGGKIAYLTDSYLYHYVVYNTSTLHTSNPLLDIDSLYCMNDLKEWLIKNNKYDENEFNFIVFREILINRAIHAAKISNRKGKEACKQIAQFCHKHIPNYTSQPFYKYETKRAKLVAFLFYHNMSFIYKLYNQLKRN